MERRMAMLNLSKLIRQTTEEFAAFGRNHLAYVKRIVTNGRIAYAVHAADGTFIWQFEDRGVAFAALRQQDMEPVSVH
jgi:hypothetical protein